MEKINWKSVSWGQVQISEDAKLDPEYLELLWRIHPCCLLITRGDQIAAVMVRDMVRPLLKWFPSKPEISVTLQLYEPYIFCGDATLRPFVDIAVQADAILSFDLDRRAGKLLLVPYKAEYETDYQLKNAIRLRGNESTELRYEVYMFERVFREKCAVEEEG